MRVVMEHRNGFSRVAGEVLADEVEFGKDLRRRGDHVTTCGVGLKYIQQLARAGPQQFGAGTLSEYFSRASHERHRIQSGVRDAPREDGDDGRSLRMERVNGALYLFQRENGSDVDDDSSAREAVNERAEKDAVLIGHRDFDVDIGTPGCDGARLRFHGVLVIRKNFQGDGPVRNNAKQVPRKRFIIENSGLAHERGIGGEALNAWIAIEAENAGKIGSVGKQLYS